MAQDNDYQEISPVSEFGSRERKMLKITGSIKLYPQSAASWSSDLAKNYIHESEVSFGFAVIQKKFIRNRSSSQRKISCYGVDINESAIALAQASGLRAAVGSEDILHLFPERRFDVAFTVCARSLA